MKEQSLQKKFDELMVFCDLESRSNNHVMVSMERLRDRFCSLELKWCADDNEKKTCELTSLYVMISNHLLLLKHEYDIEQVNNEELRLMANPKCKENKEIKVWGIIADGGISANGMKYSDEALESLKKQLENFQKTSPDSLVHIDDCVQNEDKSLTINATVEKNRFPGYPIRIEPMLSNVEEKDGVIHKCDILGFSLVSRKNGDF
jgi:hypothetical protein